MKKLFLLVLISFLIVACNAGGENGPDDSQSTDDQADTAITPDSPRVEPPPTATTLPPTWTPMPMEHSGHLPGAAEGTGASTSESSGAIPISGTRVVYTVQRGDTLAEICAKYDASIDEVARINDISDWDHIEVGQVLTIPIGN